MKKIFLLCVLFSQSFLLPAQHCPWDCSGMILLQTNVPKAILYKLHPVLVEENKKEITDTIYGTGKDTYDPCVFLSYDDFRVYRIKRMQVHDSYKYDTVYYFAKGLYMVKYNYCEYNERNLYLRFVDAHASVLTYHYIEIPDSLRIHLHDYNTELREGKKDEMSKQVTPFILTLNCEAFYLRKEECR